MTTDHRGPMPCSQCWPGLYRWESLISAPQLQKQLKPSTPATYVQMQACKLMLARSWLSGKDPDAGKDWRQEEKGMIEDETVGWHHWLDGPGFGWAPGVGDGQGGLVSQSWTRLSDWADANAVCSLKEKYPRQHWFLKFGNPQWIVTFSLFKRWKVSVNRHLLHLQKSSKITAGRSILSDNSLNI